MWQTKTFASKASMQSWLDLHAAGIQWHEIFVNNAYGIEYRKLRIIRIRG